MATVPMKTQLIKITTQPVKKGILAASIRTLVAVLLFVATSTQVLAVDAVWLLNPGSGNWNTGTNWSTSPSAPVNPGDTAKFNALDADFADTDVRHNRRVYHLPASGECLHDQHEREYAHYPRCRNRE
jgi:hypothetical protein